MKNHFREVKRNNKKKKTVKTVFGIHCFVSQILNNSGSSERKTPRATKVSRGKDNSNLLD